MGLSPRASRTPQRLEQLQQHSSRDQTKPLKGYHIVPHDVDEHDDRNTNDLREPLHTDSSEHSLRRKSTRSLLASSRVQRDQLLRKMEELIMKEAELASAYELFDYTRKRCSQEHEQIVAKLAHYEALLHDVQAREAAMRDSGVDDVLQSEQERERWRHTQDMVSSTLPELLTRLEDNIDINSAKIWSIQEKMEAIRAHRLAVREEIALKEEDIALALQ